MSAAVLEEAAKAVEMASVKPLKLEFRVRGMRCGACVRTISNAVGILEDFKYIDLDLDSGRLIVEYIGSAPDEASGMIVNELEDIGFDTDRWNAFIVFKVVGMTCQSCVKTICGHLKMFQSCEVIDLSLKTGLLLVDPLGIDPSAISAMILEELDDIGFETVPYAEWKKRETSNDTVSKDSKKKKSTKGEKDTEKEHSKSFNALNVVDYDELDHIRLSIGGMTCASCVFAIENAMKTVDGVHKAVISLILETMDVYCAPGQNSVDAIVEAVEDAGYETSGVQKIECGADAGDQMMLRVESPEEVCVCGCHCVGLGFRGL